MTAPPIERGSRRWSIGSLAAPTVVLATAVALLAPRFTPEPLHAAPFEDVFDTDEDGLPNAQEFVLGTSQYVADTDGDGYTDAEELASGSDPLQVASIPPAVASGELRIGITARGERGMLRLHLALYSENGDFDTSVLRVGALANGNVLSVPFHRLLPFADIRSVEVGNGAEVRTIDIEMSPVLVHMFGATTFFVAVGAQGSLQYQSAAKVDLYSVQNTLLIRRPVSASQQGTPVPGGSLRQPIPTTGPGSIPSNWLAGQICYQHSAVTGVIGAKVVHEVVSATCLPGWDTYCPSDCAASIGNSYETIDPAVLLGG
ncbi:MAG: thrombospondin type 3 repeat-containing protein [Planctomycetota bacterium]